MAMKKVLIALFALSVLAAGTLTAHAEDPLLWKSSQPTGRVTNFSSGQTVENCYATIRLKTSDGKGDQYYNPMECTTPNVRNYVSMSWPADEPLVNMTGFREAHHGLIEPNGDVVFY
jgi:hypothetical protein